MQKASRLYGPQVGRYTFVAVQANLSDWLAFAVFLWLGADEIVSQALSRVVGAVVAFLGHRQFSFHALEEESTVQARRFVVVWFLSYALALSTLAAFGENGLGLAPWWAKLIADGCSFAFNFVILRLWVFKVPSSAGPMPETADAAD